MLSHDLIARMLRRASESTQEGRDLRRVCQSYGELRAEVEALRRQVAILARRNEPHVEAAD